MWYPCPWPLGWSWNLAIYVQLMEENAQVALVTMDAGMVPESLLKVENGEE